MTDATELHARLTAAPERIVLDPDYNGWNDQVVGWAAAPRAGEGGSGMSALAALIDRVEAGDLWAPDAPAVSSEVGDLIERALNMLDADGNYAEGYDETWSLFVGAYGGSLDDARELHKTVLPSTCTALVETIEGWCARVSQPVGADLNPENVEYHFMGKAVSFDGPARAWLLATLRALAAHEGDA